MALVDKYTNDKLARLVAILPELSGDQLRILLLFAEFLKAQQDAGKLPLDKQ